jgi:UDP-N-acetylenolpyruvoylglucosamine reductase
MDLDQKYLFIGAGGMGMAPLACWMSQAGYSVSGYDAHLQERVRRWLADAGVTLLDFILPQHLGRFTTVVYSSAVKESHPLMQAARAAGLRVLRRGVMLAEVAKHKRFIAVVGSHGKTTTSGMIAHGLRHSGIAADYILGGLSSDANVPPARAMGSECLIAEVDESDGTIDGFAPAVTLVLNVDWDHADRYGDASKLDEAFTGLLNRTQETLFLPPDFHLQSSGPATVQVFQGAAARMGLATPPRGRFNQKNGDAAAAVLALFERPLPPDALSSFPGMARRQTILHRDASLTIVEDYAHHPTEVEALIECLRANEPEQQLVVVFQPHRYSRTRQFKAAFAAVLQAADEVFLLPVYAAHESAVPGGESADLARAFDGVPPVSLDMSLRGICALSAHLGDTPTQLAFVGAGDIEEFAGAYAAYVRAAEFADCASRRVDAAFLDYLASQVSPDCVLKQAEPLANKTTIRIGGPARLYAEPANLSDVQVLLRAAKFFDLPIFCIGRGSNLLVSDAGFDGLVIRFAAPAWRRVERLDATRIWAAAGGRLKEICGFAAKNGLGGFEFLEGIPGAVGGALRMNAGAMGSWMFDVVERVQFIDADGHYQDLPKEAFHFAYRKVDEISRGIALGVVLRQVDAQTEPVIRERMERFALARKEHQPRGASAGCIFKNPEGNFAGKLIDELGIKGMQVGAAQVSEVHGNFIVNLGGAQAADVIELVQRVRAQVKAKSGYLLEPEVLLVGRTWDEVLSE